MEDPSENDRPAMEGYLNLKGLDSYCLLYLVLGEIFSQARL